MQVKTEIKVGDLVIVKTDCLYIVEVSQVDEVELLGRYKFIENVVDRPQKWDAGGCRGLFDEYELVEILYSGPIEIKDNLFYCEGVLVDAMVASFIAECNGYKTVEQYIKDNNENRN